MAEHLHVFRPEAAIGHGAGHKLLRRRPQLGVNREQPRRPTVRLQPAEHFGFVENAASPSRRQPGFEHRGNLLRAA
jgi:hypothetical protein